MKFTINWLKKYIAFDLGAAQLADRLTMLGLEVDSVEALNRHLDKVKTAVVREVSRHPNADKLTLCDVDLGADGMKRVVCGAPNVRPGLVTAMALPGAELPGGFVIKKSKIRGEASDGMLCSAKELGIGAGESGIMELPDDLAAGLDLARALELDDVAVEVDLTPNRPDCASVLGLAREVAGFSGTKVQYPVKPTDLPTLTGKKLPFSVTVEDSVACPRYAARLLRQVKIGPSPQWLQRLLLAVGQRPVNNVVDITNFVMLEYGQPLHAFDFAKLAGGRIVVRRAVSGEKLTTLDSQERLLSPEMLVISDAERPVALAGVMGGENTEVDDTTCDILLESAYFDPVAVRRAARLAKLSTESSYRFERGVDIAAIPLALERAVQLMVELAGATVVADGFDLQVEPPARPSIVLRTGRVNSLLGLALSTETIAHTLAGIEISSEPIDEQTLRVTSPSFRVDLEREIDLVEEVARLVGYNEIPTTLPQVPMAFPETDGLRQLRHKLAGAMVGCGFYEAINYSFVAEKHGVMLGLAPAPDAMVRLLNPLVEEQAVMRTTLLPGLLENVRRNINHQNGDLRLFEIGKAFTRVAGSLPEEKIYLNGVLSGRRQPGASQLHFGNDAADLLDVKGVVEQLCRGLRVPSWLFKLDVAPPPFVEPGSHVAVFAGDFALGWFGTLSAQCLKEFGIKQDVHVLELDLQALEKAAGSSPVFQPLPKYPAVKWDIAVVVPENVGGGEILAAVREAGEKLVEDVEIFDVYRGKNIDAGHKSVAVSVTYRSQTQTLDDETVAKKHQKLIDKVLSRVGGRLREV